MPIAPRGHVESGNPGTVLTALPASGTTTRLKQLRQTPRNVCAGGQGGSLAGLLKKPKGKLVRWHCHPVVRDVRDRPRAYLPRRKGQSYGGTMTDEELIRKIEKFCDANIGQKQAEPRFWAGYQKAIDDVAWIISQERIRRQEEKKP